MHKQHLYTFAWKIFCIRKSVVCRTRCLPSSARRRYDLPGAACPASGRVCRCVAWSALLPVLCGLSGCAGGLGSPPAGYIGSAWGGVVDTSRRKNSKKAFFGVRAANTHPTFTNQNPSDCASLQKFRKIQKDPFRSLDCGIISKSYVPKKGRIENEKENRCGSPDGYLGLHYVGWLR